MKRSYMRRRSAKKAKRDREYVPVHRQVLEEEMGCFYARTIVEQRIPPCHFEMHVHHRVSRARGGTDERSNLVVLCRDHHDWTHSSVEGRRLGEELGLLRRNPRNQVGVL